MKPVLGSALVVVLLAKLAWKAPTILRTDAKDLEEKQTARCSGLSLLRCPTATQPCVHLLGEQSTSTCFFEVILTAWAFAKGPRASLPTCRRRYNNPACGLNQPHCRGASFIIFRLLGNHVCFYEFLSAVSISECIGNGASSRIQKRVLVCEISAELRFEAVFMAAAASFLVFTLRKRCALKLYAL